MAHEAPTTAATEDQGTPTPTTSAAVTGETQDPWEEFLGKPMPSALQARHLCGDHGWSNDQPGHVRGRFNTWTIDHGLGQFG